MLINGMIQYRSNMGTQKEKARGGISGFNIY
ncbi:hypothetical protein ViNHUV68_10130 [Vibrio sp. NH-UV-68]